MFRRDMFRGNDILYGYYGDTRLVFLGGAGQIEPGWEPVCPFFMKHMPSAPGPEPSGHQLTCHSLTTIGGSAPTEC